MYLFKRNDVYPENMPLLLFGDTFSLLWNAGMLKQWRLFLLKDSWQRKTNDPRFNPQDFRENFTALWSPETFKPLELVYTHQ